MSPSGKKCCINRCIIQLFQFDKPLKSRSLRINWLISKTVHNVEKCIPQIFTCVYSINQGWHNSAWMVCIVYHHIPFNQNHTLVIIAKNPLEITRRPPPSVNCLQSLPFDVVKKVHTMFLLHYWVKCRGCTSLRRMRWIRWKVGQHLILVWFTWQII